MEPIDDWTIKLESLLLKIAKAARDNNKKYYIGGGFALDLSIGKLTRSHEDIDFFPMEEDTSWWKEWFKKKGFILSKEKDMERFPNAFLPTNEKRYYFADVYPVLITKKGEIAMLGKNGKHGIWKGKSWFEVKKVNYKGMTVYIENPKTVLSQKIEHARKHKIDLSDKHKKDIEMFGN